MMPTQASREALVLPEIASVKICVNGAIPLDGMATTFRSLVLAEPDRKSVV